ERIYKPLAVDPSDVLQYNPRVSAGLWTVLRRMLAKHPDDRFQTPGELVQALRSIPSTLAGKDETEVQKTDAQATLLEPDSDSAVDTVAATAELRRGEDL